VPFDPKVAGGGGIVACAPKIGFGPAGRSCDFRNHAVLSIRAAGAADTRRRPEPRPGHHRAGHGTWRYRFETKTLAVAVLFEDEHRLWIVTAFDPRKKRQRE
jgi:hypothetical protein